MQIYRWGLKRWGMISSRINLSRVSVIEHQLILRAGEDIPDEADENLRSQILLPATGLTRLAGRQVCGDLTKYGQRYD